MDFQLPDYGQLPTFEERLEKAGVKPADRYVLDRIALGRQNQLVRRGMTEAVNNGQTISQIGEQADLAQAQQTLAEFLEKNKGLPSEQYAALEANLKNEVARVVNAPRRPDLKPPTAAQAIFAALGALANPDYAFEIGATPFQEGIRQQEQGFQEDQLRYENDMRERGIRIEMARDQLRAQGQIDERDWRAKYGQLLADVESAGRIKAEEIQQQGLNYRAGLMVDRANIGADSKTELLLLKGITQDKIGGPLRAQNAELLRSMFPDRYSGLSDEDIAKIAASQTPGEVKTGAETKNIEEETRDLVATRPARLAKIAAETKRIYAQADKLGADAAFVRKKTDLYDDEFAVRAANVYSQIAQRQAKASGAKAGSLTTKDIEAQISDYERIARLAKANLKTMRVWDATAGVYMPRPGVKPETIAELEQEIINANNAAMQLSADLAEIRKAQRGSPQQGPPRPDRLPGRGEWETGGSVPPMRVEGLNVVPNQKPAAPQRQRTMFDGMAEAAKIAAGVARQPKPKAKPKQSPSNRGTSPLQRAIQGSQNDPLGIRN